jgi:hypothetical protein
VPLHPSTSNFGNAPREISIRLYAGLDVSMDETSICVVDRDGIKEFQATTEIVRWLFRFYPECRQLQRESVAIPSGA